MLLYEPIFYYEQIKNKFPKSYLAEDKFQAIIGIDCEYFDAKNYDLDALVGYYNANLQKSQAPFAGLFGVFAHGSVKFFEDIAEPSECAYEFPEFFYANANAYLHFDKVSKIYTFYGDNNDYYEFLKELKPLESKYQEAKFQILTDLDAEKKHFEDIVEKAKEYVRSGDVFQVVLAKQLKISSNLDSVEFYKKLSTLNPSPYMFHFPTPYGDIVGSSPELVFEMRDKKIFVAPIAGTRPRGSDANEDERLKNDLLSDEKELAEHKMLIDLARNDIGHVAKPRSVVVKNPMHIQYYESVMHIVSEVYGICRDNLSWLDVIRSIFPAGTLSGTPKIRAMQIISELEGLQRGIYGGGIGFLHFNGDVQMAILIRSAFFNAKTDTKGFRDVFVGAGAGIVYDSTPKNEYAEICHKRASVVRVFRDNCKEVR
ncbi:anthranilate synthase component I family protein [Campylobacter sp. RM13119]|uniref:anthranilate synthase component I family protein n=1 Tax=Campylobacter TaxID=194 RepID=UPI00147451F1|nr:MULTISPECIES: anthranilate synthase component I family protein [unclassified Campylobacter]MBE3605930.1 anthranilate synthase component I family protein [Campylobacter sp. RM13119]MBE3609602.1 anthranilate synthase component I family protein [Campylobacter sp. RM12916]